MPRFPVSYKTLGGATVVANAPPKKLKPRPFPLHLNKKELVARGWTRTLIARLLGEPDLILPKRTRWHGGHYEHHLYAKSRIEEAEASPAFQIRKKIDV